MLTTTDFFDILFPGFHHEASRRPRRRGRAPTAPNRLACTLVLLAVATLATPQPAAAQTTLTGLTLSPNDIDFSSEERYYSIGVANDVGSVTVTATGSGGQNVIIGRTDYLAHVLDTTDADSEAADHQVSLEVGYNLISVRVSSCAFGSLPACGYYVVVGRESLAAWGWKAFEDFDVLAGENRTTGIWSDGITMWVADSTAAGSKPDHSSCPGAANEAPAATLYAYSLDDKSRDSDKDFTDLNCENSHIGAIWSDGTTMWVSDWFDARLYAYDMETKDPEPEKDFDHLVGQNNVGGYGMWSDGRTMWVSDIYDRKIYAYRVSDTTHDPDKDFTREMLEAGGIGTPRGIWSNGRTMWVVSSGLGDVEAFNMSDKSPDATKDFDLEPVIRNGFPRDIWSDGNTIWIAHAGSGGGDATRRHRYLQKIYSFDATGIGTSPVLPPGTDQGGGGNVSISSATAGEGDPTIDFTVTLSQEPTREVTVSYETSGAPDGGTAIEGTDYSRARGTLRIPANTRMGTISVSLRDDSLNEDNETFTLTLTGATNATLSSTPSRNTATGTIRDDDQDLPVLSIEGGRAIEGQGATVTFTVTLAPESGREVSVNWATQGGSAAQNQDYQGESGTLTFSAGDTSQTISVTVTDDTLDEAVEEQFTVRLNSPRNATLSPDASSATGTIVDDDGDPSLSIESAEASEGSGRIRFTVTLIPQSAQAVEVSYDTRDGTAIAGEDYVAVEGGTLTFSAGQTSKTISVTVTNDTLDEDDETFDVVLRDPSNAELAATATATGTIEDNDSEPQLSISNVSASEADATIDFTVRLNRASGKAVTVEYETSGAPVGGTATEGSDYTRTAGTLSFDPAADPPDTEKTISVPITPDTLNELAETFTLTLSSPTNGTFGGSRTSLSATGTIQNDDPVPVLMFSSASLDVTGPEGTGTIDFVVLLNLASGQPVMVDYRTSNGTATAGQDYTETRGTLSFAPGETQMTIQVPVKEDDVYEGDQGETFTLTLSGPSNAQVDTQQRNATGTITDNDSDSTGIELTVNPTTVSEGGGSQTVTVTAGLNGPVRTTSTAVTVTVTGTGQAGVVGFASVGNFTISIPERRKSASRTFNLSPVDNAINEADETVTVTGTAEGLTASSATIELRDNDGPLTGVTLSVRPTSISEGAGERTVTVTARLDGSAQTADTVVAVTVLRVGGTDAVDFTASPSSFNLTIEENSSSGQETFTLTPTDDEIDGADATARVTGTVAGLESGVATLTVEDNDEESTRVTLSVDPNAVSEGDGSTPVTVTATLNRSARTEDTAVSVQVSGSGNANVVGFSANPASFSIQIPMGSLEGSQTFSLNPSDNASKENSETVTLRGSTAVPGLDVLSASLVLNDDDGGTVVRPPGGSGGSIRPRSPGGVITPTPVPEPEVEPEIVLPSIGRHQRAVDVRLAIWTHRPGYSSGQQILLYRTSDPLEEMADITFFVYRENIETGKRQYLGGIGSDSQLKDDVTDFYGNSDPDFKLGLLESVTKELIWYGTASDPGRWQFVAEVRSPDRTQVLRKAYAKFVVSGSRAVNVNLSGTQTSITSDTTWTSDTIYGIGNSVTVTSGATLTIEAGTLIRASGIDASIVVEKGGRIVANGRRESPVVMTCNEQVGKRQPGCWGGLIIRGNAPASTTAGSVTDSISDTEPAYGGDDASDSSGALRFVRVEFAGAAAEDATERPAAVGLFGVGSGTVIKHLQAHEAAGDGISFQGGTALCLSCVSSGAGGSALEWAQGWAGVAQHLYIHQGARSQHGIHASGVSANSNSQQEADPMLYNATLVGHQSTDSDTSSEFGMLVRDGAKVFARNLLVTGFSGGALQVVGEGTAAGFTGGTSSVRNAIAYDSGGSDGPVEIEGDAGENIAFTDADPMLFITRYEANPDPRPEFGSATLVFGAVALLPSDGMLSRSAQYIQLEELA